MDCQRLTTLGPLVPATVHQKNAPMWSVRSTALAARDSPPGTPPAPRVLFVFLLREPTESFLCSMNTDTESIWPIVQYICIVGLMADAT